MPSGNTTEGAKMSETQVVSTNLSDPDGKAVYSGILTRNHDTSANTQLVLVVDGIAYGPDDLLYGEDGSWGKAGEIVLSSSLGTRQE
jgi:hypothetical protein